MKPDNSQEKTNSAVQTAASEEPRTVQELELDFQARQQRLRAYGAKSCGELKISIGERRQEKRQRIRSMESRLTELRREMEDVERDIEDERRQAAEDIRVMQQDYRQTCEEIAFRRAALMEWYAEMQKKLRGN